MALAILVIAHAQAGLPLTGLHLPPAPSAAPKGAPATKPTRSA